MKFVRIVPLALACVIVASPAFAGIPLKGAGVSLGKIPGGGCAARTTNAAGEADFGIWPALPAGVHYTITVTSLPQDATITIQGAAGGPITRDIAVNAATARASAPIAFDTDGKHRIIVVVGAARIKSHSNSTNN